MMTNEEVLEIESQLSKSFKGYIFKASINTRFMGYSILLQRGKYYVGLDILDEYLTKQTLISSVKRSVKKSGLQSIKR